MRTICFDLDGTLLDVTERYYTLYKEAMISSDVPPIGKKEYCHLIRSGIKHWEIFEKWHNRKIYSHYIEYRNQRIEHQKYLGLDCVIPDMRRVLGVLAMSYRLVVVSNRDSLVNMKWQLGQTRISSFFSDVLAAGFQTGTTGKAESIKQVKGDILIGDTEIDLETGKLYSLKTISVSWGLRSYAWLKRLYPDQIVNHPGQLLNLLL